MSENSIEQKQVQITVTFPQVASLVSLLDKEISNSSFERTPKKYQQTIMDFYKILENTLDNFLE